MADSIEQLFPVKTTKILDAALDYAGRGWRVVPLHTCDKRPHPRGWQKVATDDPEVITGWFQQWPDANVGIALGEDSGIVDIECDDEQAEKTLEDLFDGDIPNTPTYLARRGKHRLFKWNAAIPFPEKNGFKIGALEFRTGNGGKGAQSVFPPSIHPDGPVYTWLVDPSEADVAELPETVMAKLSVYSDEPTLFDKPAATSKPQAKLQEHWDAIASGVSEGSRNETAASFIGKLLRSLSDPFDNGAVSNQWTLIFAWNNSNRPPLPEKELRTTFDSILRRHRDNWARGRVEKIGSSPISEPSLETDDGRTEIANARRFLAQHGDKVLYCKAMKRWLVWGGSRWIVDHGGAVARMVKSVAESLWHQIAGVSLASQKQAISFVKSSCSAAGVRNVVELAAVEVPIEAEELDANRNLLNCQNGTFNTLTGEFREHRKEDHITTICLVAYNPNATSPVWDRFLEGALPDLSMRSFIQRWFGYSLTGDIREQKFVVFHGGGSNGKSTLLTLVQEHILGPDYSSAAPESLLMAKKYDSHPTEKACLFRQRLVISMESEKGRKLDEAAVKRLTGGDMISARFCGKDFFTFSPTHKLIISTNHKPTISGDDGATWRRIAMVPFDQKFWDPDQGETGPEQMRQDKALPSKMKAEAEGILAWMIRGCVAWRNDGLHPPDTVRSATQKYRREQDVIGRFVDERCVKRGDVRVTFRALYDALALWCEECGEDVPSRKAMGQWLDEREFEEANTAKAKGRRGIALAV